MNFRSSILGAAALLGLSMGAAWAQEPADPIAGLLEQAQEAPADPNDPEGESVATPPDAAALERLRQTQSLSDSVIVTDGPRAEPPGPAPIAPLAPLVPRTPATQQAPYVPPPVNHAPPSPTYARPPADYAPVTPPPAPYAPPYVPPPPRPQIAEPVHIDEVGKTPDAPPSPVDRNYEMRLRASSASAQGLQGPLDGAWTLRASGNELYSLLLVDNGLALEGAWRDPRRRGATDSSGFLNDIQRTGAGISLNFYSAPGAGLTTVTLAPTADGSWTGEIDENGRRRNVTLRRH